MLHDPLKVVTEIKINHTEQEKAMNKLRDEWEKKRRKTWEKQLGGYDEDACEQMPEDEDSLICTKASPASRGIH